MNKLFITAAAALFLVPLSLKAQAPAGSTGQCKDGSYTSVASKSGACRGHKGVQTWFADAPATAAASSKTTPAAPMAKTAAPAAQPSKPVPAAPAPAPSATAKPTGTTPTMTTSPSAKPSPAAKSTAAKSGTAKQPAPGGGPGMVWVNTSSKVYHCPGSDDYGTTKAGKYMSEGDAKAMGAHAAYNKPCSAK